MQSYPIKKRIFQHTKISISHRNKTNAQQPFSNIACHCELAVHLLLFEKTSVLRLHCGNPFAPIQSLYTAVLWAKPVSARAAGKLCKITSSRALNRPRSPEVRKPLACFLILFARRKKNVKTSPLQGTPRFSKPRISPPQPQLRTATIKTFLRKPRGSANLVQALRFSRLRQSASVLRFTSKLKSTNANKVQTFGHKAGRQIKNSLGGKTEKPQRLSFLCFIRKFSAH